MLRVEIACKDEAEAGKIMNVLLETHLAACGQSVPVTSTYQWQGQVESDSEVLLIIKTQEKLFEKLCACVKAHHSYDLPEITGTVLNHVDPAYEKWIVEVTNGL